MAPFFLGLGITLLIGFLFIAIILHFSHKKEDRIAVDMPLAPAFLWFNTAASLSIELNLNFSDGNQIFKYMAGLENPYETSINQALRNTLKSAWGIVDAQTAEENMEDLLKNGMRSRYNEDMELLLFKYGNLSEQQLIDLVPDSNEDSFLPKMIMAYRRIGKNAILGWDIGRLCYYAQICYFVGYISKEKMLELCTEGGKMAQSTFLNWEEMMESYILGMQYWKNENAQDPKSSTFKLLEYYKKILVGSSKYRLSPYLSVPFDTDLSSDVLTDDRGYSVNNLKEN